MVGQHIVKCSKCGKDLFYLKDGYGMADVVVCIECGEKKKSTKKKKKVKTIKTAAANYARTRKGKRLDIHPTYMFRSATEANFARILEHLGMQWKFEERSFVFDGYKTKPHVYIMDFEIIKIDKRKTVPEGMTEGFYEIKGYMNAQSRNKLRRLKKNYPEEAANTVVVIYTKYKKADIAFCEKLGYKYLFYDVLTKEFEPLIPTWE